MGVELDACDGDAFNSIRVSLTSHPINESGLGKTFLSIDTQATEGPCQFFLKVDPTPESIDQFFSMNLIEVSMYEWTQGGHPPGETLRFHSIRVFYEPGEGVVVPTMGTTTVLTE